MAQDNKYAARVRDYWNERGYVVTTHAIEAPERHYGSYTSVRSDLCNNGLPWNYKNDGALGLPVSTKGKVR